MTWLRKRPDPRIQPHAAASRQRYRPSVLGGFVCLGSVSVVLAALAAAPQLGPALVVSRPLPYADAVIALASHEWERLPLVALLAAAHPDALVVLTRPTNVTPFNCHDCANRVDRLRNLGVSESRVRVVPITQPGTHGEALAALAFARHAHIRHLLIATSPYHTRRSLAVFRRVFAGTGVDIGIEPANESSPAQPSRWWWMPYDRAYVSYEWAAIVYYTGRYGVRLSDLQTDQNEATVPAGPSRHP